MEKHNKFDPVGSTSSKPYKLNFKKNYVKNAANLTTIRQYARWTKHGSSAIIKDTKIIDIGSRTDTHQQCTSKNKCPQIIPQQYQ